MCRRMQYRAGYVNRPATVPFSSEWLVEALEQGAGSGVAGHCGRPAQRRLNIGGWFGSKAGVGYPVPAVASGVVVLVYYWHRLL